MATADKPRRGKGSVFRNRDGIPPLLASNIREAWMQTNKSLPRELGADFHLLDPAFHPAESVEYAKWIRETVEEVAQEKKRLSKSIAGKITPRDLADCDDSAFRLKSAAAAHRQSELAAPLCVGVAGCRTQRGDEHMVNWVVSCKFRQKGERFTVRYALWFVDFRALVEAVEAGWNFEGAPPAKFRNDPPRMLHLLATPEAASKFIKLPFLILA